MSKETKILQRGDKGYEAAIAAIPVHAPDGTFNRVPTFADAQRAADEATNAEVAAAAKQVKPADTTKGGK